LPLEHALDGVDAKNNSARTHNKNYSTFDDPDMDMRGTDAYWCMITVYCVNNWRSHDYS
jgi:hypothetical protein